MTDITILSAANTIGNWRTRRIWNGRVVTDDELRTQVQTRWPDLSQEQIAEVVALIKTRSER